MQLPAQNRVLIPDLVYPGHSGSAQNESVMIFSPQIMGSHWLGLISLVHQMYLFDILTFDILKDYESTFLTPDEPR